MIDCPTCTASHLCPDCAADRAERAAEDEMYRAADAAAAAGEPHAIVDAEYEPGVPGRACLACDSGWPASEADAEPWHHAHGCPAVSP